MPIRRMRAVPIARLLIAVIVWVATTSGQDRSLKDEVASAVKAAIEARETPGGVVWVGRGDERLLWEAWGRRRTVPSAQPMEPTTRFDCASLTKPMACAFRIGDSCTNVISPMMSYFALIMAFMQRYDPKAGLGTLVATMLPYALFFLVVWTALFWIWMEAGLPLGPK